jgi:protein tyrosine/serine phosphatase
VNLRPVGPFVTRCDQPNPEAWPVLAQVAQSVLCLRKDGEDGGYSLSAEEAAVEHAGMRFASVPIGEMPWDAPTQDQIRVAVALLSDGRSWIVHCRRGCDRTGVIVACYRIVYCGWSKERAIKEANECGMSRLQVRMHEFLEHFLVSPTDNKPAAISDYGSKG